jgi:SAM-dependent methyltransferase
MDDEAGATGRAAHWFEPIAEFLGPAYLRYSFTKGTEQEVTSLIELLGLVPGQRVLDVGCGPGRHALALAARGVEVVGVDISADFVAAATERARAAGLDRLASFEVGDARDLGLDQAFDAAISLCQGAFGLSGGPGALVAAGRELDEPILAGMARALVDGGRLAVSAFSAYFQLRYLEDGDTFDADRGVNHETTMLRDGDGNERPAELWTTCYTPRELRLLARMAGLRVLAVHGVAPGAYRPSRPTIDVPELLLVAER